MHTFRFAYHVMEGNIRALLDCDRQLWMCAWWKQMWNFTPFRWKLLIFNYRWQGLAVCVAYYNTEETHNPFTAFKCLYLTFSDIATGYTLAMSSLKKEQERKRQLMCYIMWMPPCKRRATFSVARRRTAWQISTPSACILTGLFLS